MIQSAKSASNPFETLAAVAPKNPFAAPQVAEQSGPTGYALVQSGPAVDPAEIENAAQSSVEVQISWGSAVLHVEHLSPPRAFRVGEEEGCDFQIPAEKLGCASAPLVVVEQGQIFAVVVPSARGWVELPGRGRVSLDEARSSARPCPQAPGSVMVALPAAARMRQEVGGLVLSVGSVAAGKKVRRALFGATALTGLMFAGLSMLGHLSVLGGLAFFKPELSGADDDEARREREIMMMQMLKASAEQEKERVEEKTPEASDGGSAGDGAAAKGPAGSMGSTASNKTGNKFAVKGRPDNNDPHISREQARDEASRFGMIGLLQATPGGDSAPTALWGRESAEGRDAFSALGNMWGANLGESHGAGGLGLTGIGEGGDGRNEGIGIGKVGTIFGGAGSCASGPCNGVGTGHGRVQGTHAAATPQVRVSSPTVSGRLAPEVIQRVVRQSFGRFRLCYENGLRGNPSLQGRVAVRFVIDRNGAVASASNGGSDLPDAATVGCVVRAFSGLSFPSPENGIVTVTYPISFTPGS